MGFTIIVDGPNFINELIRHGKDKEYIMNSFSFPNFHALIQNKLKRSGLYSHPFLHTEFICSNVNKLGCFEGEEKEIFLKKLKHSKGVSVRQINLSRNNGEEKGVDMYVFAKMLERGSDINHIVLIAKDKDYVPAIEVLTSKGIHTVLVGFDDGNFPIELINECYLFIDLSEILEKMENMSD